MGVATNCLCKMSKLDAMKHLAQRGFLLHLKTKHILVVLTNTNNAAVR
jgi:hypothetical protein